MFGCLLGQIRFRDPDFLSVELVQCTSVITGPKLTCNQAIFFSLPKEKKSPDRRLDPSVIKVSSVTTETIGDMSTTA